MAGTYGNVPAVVRKEDASCFRCNLSRVVTTFQSSDIPELDSHFRELIFISKLEVIVCVVRCDVTFII